MNYEEHKPEVDDPSDALRALHEKHLEAKENGKLKEYYLDRFLHSKNDCSDDLPNVDLRDSKASDERGLFIGGEYKCRGNYISGLSKVFSVLLEEGVITSPEIIGKIETFCQHDWNFYHNQPTTREEIDLINQILDAVIEYLRQ